MYKELDLFFITHYESDEEEYFENQNSDKIFDSE